MGRMRQAGEHWSALPGRAPRAKRNISTLQPSRPPKGDMGLSSVLCKLPCGHFRQGQPVLKLARRTTGPVTVHPPAEKSRDRLLNDVSRQGLQGLSNVLGRPLYPTRASSPHHTVPKGRPTAHCPPARGRVPEGRGTRPP